jgi:transposase
MATTKEVLQRKDSAGEIGLWIAFELSGGTWKLAFGGADGKTHWHSIDAGSQAQCVVRLEQMRAKLGVGRAQRAVSCYEAGRDGFWLHRWLGEIGVENVVVEPASIEVNRRARRAKSDRLDGAKLLGMLRRYHGGEASVWRVLHVPSPAQEDARRGARERARLLKERTAHRNRIGALLALHNVRERRIGGRGWEARLTALARALPPRLWRELERESARLALVQRQLRAVEAEIKAARPAKVSVLTRLKGIGAQGAETLVAECFGWRRFANRREVGAVAGRTPTPYDSGASRHEQGISKDGNKRLRAMLIELGWQWLRHQPQSKESLWFVRRFGAGGARARRIGIVALARRLLIALWRYVEHGILPEGAQLKATAA